LPVGGRVAFGLQHGIGFLLVRRVNGVEGQGAVVDVDGAGVGRGQVGGEVVAKLADYVAVSLVVNQRGGGHGRVHGQALRAAEYLRVLAQAIKRNQPTHAGAHQESVLPRFGRGVVGIDIRL
jgi:hypothetical protein